MSSLLSKIAGLLPSVLHPKVATTALGGALATVILWVLSSTGHSAPPEVAAAIVTVVGFLAGYLTPSQPSGSPKAA